MLSLHVGRHQGFGERGADAAGRHDHPHHTVGRDYIRWYEAQRPEIFASALRAARKSLDPRGILNPGVLFR